MCRVVVCGVSLCSAELCCVVCCSAELWCVVVQSCGVSLCSAELCCVVSMCKVVVCGVSLCSTELCCVVCCSAELCCVVCCSAELWCVVVQSCAVSWYRVGVQSHSVIRFRKRKGRQQLRGRRRSMPRADDEHNFLSWVRRRLKVVTSYSELNGDKLLFYLQHGGVANVVTLVVVSQGRVQCCDTCGCVSGGVVSGECRLNEMKASPFALVAQREQQAVTGCISTGSKNVLDRPVYVIELLGVGEVEEKGGEEAGVEGVRKGGGQVELDIGSASGKKMEHDFYLVLRSPPTVKWVLRTHRLNGWIDVVTNADADLRGIHMHTVALRRELMEASGAELIDWTEYYVAPVRAYTAVTAANILQLRLPAQGK
ncbi:hypothetical protein ACOMHN_055926 [Nucella lapillus]